MDTKHLLMTNRADHLKFVLKQCEKTAADLRDAVDAIRTWLKTQRHLPETSSEDMITSFIIMNKFSIENTKIKLDMYYTIRSIVPEIYENKNPRLPHMQQIMKVMCACPLPRMTKEGYRVTVMKMLEETADNFDPYNFFAHSYNIVEIRILEDLPLGDVLIYDLEFFNMGHMMKLTPVTLKKSILVLEKVFSNRVKGIHYINSPPFIGRLISMIKSLLKPKLAARLHVHRTMDSILEEIPREILPKDYGGEDMSLQELNELWRKKLAEYQDRFDVLDKLRTNEQLRPTPLVNDDVLGFHGNFKKLNVD